LQERQSYFHTKFGINFFGPFGSFSHRNETVESDIDILYNIDKDRKLSMFKYSKIALVRVDALKPKVKEEIIRVFRGALTFKSNKTL